MADDNDKPTITRRRALGGLATIGAAGALGSGTWAYFSDEEEVAAQFTGGKLDGKIEYETNYNGDRMEKSDGYVQADPNANTVVLTVNDMKPGDYGSLVFGIKAGTNAAWVASCVSAENNTENGQPEPEDDTSGGGELADNMYIIPFYDSNVESSFFDSATPSPIDIGSATVEEFWDNATDTLKPETVADVVTSDLASGTVEWLDDSDNEAMEASSLESPPPAAPDTEKGCVLLNGAQGNNTTNEQEFAPLQPGDTIQFGYDFAVPYTVGNEIQTDTLDVMFAFEFIQARHNENPADGQWEPGANTGSTTSS